MIIYPKVLFVTNKDDLAIDYLIYKFKDRDTDYIRLNSEDIVNLSVNYDLESINLKYDNNLYDLSNLKSVYFRRAPTIFPNAIEYNDTPFINTERKNFLEGLYCSLNVKWINSLFSTYKAERKLYQLTTAKRVGFSVPKTIVSNNPSEIMSFIEEHGNCIIKPICHGLQVTREGAFSIYTSETKNMQLLDKDLLFECPAFIQKKINNYRDIRATVVGRKIFAVEIETDEKFKIDWRKPELEKKYKIHNLPDSIKKLMFKLHEELDLIYSAFDFILTPDGEYFFLETNPAGEWVWLERELNLPISNAIINELLC